MWDLTGSGAEPLGAEDPVRIGPVPLAGRLGAGGMGRVYLGVHEGRYVAVKQLLASVVAEDEDFLRRFGHELDNLARLPADATAPLLAGDRAARPPWFATAYIPGITLSEAVALHGGPLPGHALWLLLREAAARLAPVHALGMVHRDLKPSNVMLTLDGLTLIDFGVARAAEQSRLTRTGMVVGTPAYMAPEQASGKRPPGGATDVFALGSVLAYAACGRPPFGDESGHGVLYRIVHEEPDLEPLREREPELADLVEACLAKDPDDRPTAPELLESAYRRGPYTLPLWPAAIDDRLTERAAFAADVQAVDVPTLPLTGGEPDPAGAGAPRADASGGASAPEGRERPERRRTRVLLAVLPVVVVAGGTTLAVQYLPHVAAPGAGAQHTPTGPVTGAAEPARAADGSPSGTAPPAPPPGEAPGQAQGAVGGAGAGPAAGTVPGGGAQPGAGGSGSPPDPGAGSGGGAGGGSRPPAGGTLPLPQRQQRQVPHPDVRGLGLRRLRGRLRPLDRAGPVGRRLQARQPAERRLPLLQRARAGRLRRGLRPGHRPGVAHGLRRHPPQRLRRRLPRPGHEQRPRDEDVRR